MRASGAEVVTVSLRREAGGERAGQGFWSLIRELGVRVLPNTAGCHSVKEAVTTAHMAREVFGTTWIKLEVIGEDDTLQPDVFGLVEAARDPQCAKGFEVFPYTTEDLVVAERLLGCGLPRVDAVGSADRLGPRTEQPVWTEGAAGALSRGAADHRRRDRRPLARRAGAGARASMRCSSTPRSRRRAIRSRWRGAFAQAVEAGHAAWLAGPIEARDLAHPSTPGHRHGVPRMNLPRVYPIVDNAAWMRRLAPLGVRLRAAADQGAAAGAVPAQIERRARALPRRRHAAGRQ